MSERTVSNAGFGYIGLKDSVTRLPWKENYRAYIHLKEAMEQAVSAGWKDGKLESGIIAKLSRTFGVDRVGVLLSYNIYRRLKEPDVTWSNKAWAGAYRTPTSKDQFGEACVAQMPGGALNALADQYRAFVIERELHGEECCLTKPEDPVYRGKVLVLRPDYLPEARLYGDNQFFYARSGFGCEPGKMGSRIFGLFLQDGREASFRRSDFIGEADEKQLPLWAQQAYAALRAMDYGDEEEEPGLLDEYESFGQRFAEG